MEKLKEQYLLLCRKFERLKCLASINGNGRTEITVELNKVKELVQALKDEEENFEDQARMIEKFNDNNSIMLSTDGMSLDDYLDKMVLIFSEDEIMDSWKRFINRFNNKNIVRNISQSEEKRIATDDGKEDDFIGQDNSEDDNFDVQEILGSEVVFEVNGMTVTEPDETQMDRWSLVTQDANLGSPPHMSDFDSCLEEDDDDFDQVASDERNKNKKKKSLESTKQKAKSNVMPASESGAKGRKYNFRTKALLAEFGLPTTFLNLGTDSGAAARIPCPVCGKEYAWKQRFMTHLKLHKREKDGDKSEPKEEPQLCTICGKTMKNKASLSQHLQRHETLDSGEYIKCRICSKEYLGKHRLQDHMTKNHTLRSYMCDICGKAYKNKQMMKTHIKSVHLKAKEACNTCGKEFSSKTNLARHMRIHRGDWPFPCSFCGKRFRASDNRMYHEKRHTGNFPYKCSLCDHVGFISPCNLREHERRYHSAAGSEGLGGEKTLTKIRKRRPRLANTQLQEAKLLNPTHRCETCGKEFSNYANLRRHALLHTGVKSHKCLVCGRLFSTGDTLKAHLWTHSTEKQFPCNVCDKGFNDKRNLISHMKRAHPEYSMADKIPYRQPPIAVITNAEPQPDFLVLGDSSQPNQQVQVIGQ